MSKKKRILRSIIEYPALAIILLTVVLIVLNELFFTSIFNEIFLKSFFRSNAGLIYVAIGTAVIIMGGGIDISLGMLLSLINVVIVQLAMKGMNVWLAVLIGLLVGIAGGAFNGFFIGILRVTPMIVTFASTSIFSGIALWVQPVAGGNISSELRNLYRADFLGLPVPVWLIILVLVITIIIFKTRLGMAIMASGYAPEKSFASGKNVYGAQFFTFLYAGLLTGIGAVCVTATMNSGDPNLGKIYSMNCISACVIGGIALSGGKGKALGAIMGTIFLALITNIVVTANVSSFYQDLLKGVIMFVSLVGASILYAKSNSSKSAKKAVKAADLEKDGEIGESA